MFISSSEPPLTVAVLKARVCYHRREGRRELCVWQEMSEREAYHLFFSTVEPPVRHRRLYLGVLKINSVKINIIVFCKTNSVYS